MMLECAQMEFANTALNNLYIAEEVKTGGRMDRMKHIDNEDDDDDAVFKSKNLKAERRRRKKLSDRLLELRSLMTKEAIITDAITYTEELQKQVRDLSYHLHEMEATPGEELKMQSEESIHPAQEMKKWGIEPEVQVSRVDEAKFWIKIVYQEKKGAFTKLMEAMSVLGFDLNDTSVTSFRGAIVVTVSVEGSRGGLTEADKVREFLLEIIRSI